jgi:hypothetical protein
MPSVPTLVKRGSQEGVAKDQREGA